MRWLNVKGLQKRKKEKEGGRDLNAPRRFPAVKMRRKTM